MRKVLLCVSAGLLMLSIAFMASGRVSAADEKTPTTKKIMGALHKGGKSPLASLKTALGSDSPNWSSVQKDTKLFATYGADLPKNEPPKGSEASWQKLAKSYASSAKALDEAARTKDAKTARTEFGKIAGSCAACHKAHKPS